MGGLAVIVRSILLRASLQFLVSASFACMPLPSASMTPPAGPLFAVHPQIAPPSWGERVLYNFQSNMGSNPTGPLLAGGPGLFFGTTQGGGQYDYGTVFELRATRAGYAETTLYSFKGSTDGAYPNGGLIQIAGTL